MGTNGNLELDDETEESPKVPLLVFDNSSEFPVNLLHSLNLMRKNRTFCDVVLHVGNVDICCHRAVLGAASPYLLELFSTDDEKNASKQAVLSYKMNGVFETGALQKLVEYAYTAKLELLPHEVHSVYAAAVHLSMERVAKKCASYLVSSLVVDNCLAVRSLPGVTKQKEFVDSVDAFITSKFSELSKSSSFLLLPCVPIEVLCTTKAEMSLVDPHSTCFLAFDWLRKFDSPCVEDFIGKTHMLYLALDNSLQDCSELPNGDAGDTELVQDYKRLSKVILSSNGGKHKKPKGTAKPRVIVYSRHIRESLEDDPNADDRVICSTKVSETSFLALVSIKGKLASMSVLLRLNPPYSNSSGHSADESDASNADENVLINTPTYYELTTMTRVRCAAGCASVNGQILVCGGYDRGECLRLVESYSPVLNKWTTRSPMLQPRGRFNIAILGGKAFAVGGCNGTTELSTVEYYSPEDDKWVSSVSLPFARSHTAVASTADKLYCIGGYDGGVSTKEVDIFSLGDTSWTSGSSALKVARYQASAVEYHGRIWVVGGCDSWNCLNSVEILDPKTGNWSLGPNLVSARRGSGLQVFQDKLYCVGGWDGTHSLASTEIYDPKSDSWCLGPSLNTPRSNLGLASIGSCLYAVGGFSNKTFLNTMEILIDDQWSTFCLPNT